MAMRIILERRRTHFSASRLVWQEVRTGKIDFYHGLLGLVTKRLTAHISGQVGSILEDITFHGAADYNPPPNLSFLQNIAARFNPKNYQFQGMDFEAVIRFLQSNLTYAVLDGDVHASGSLSSDLTGSFNGSANVKVKFAQWYIPNARVRTFNARLEAEVASHSGHCLATVGLTGHPDFFLFRIVLPSVNLHGRAESRSCCRDLGLEGVGALLAQAAQRLNADTHIFGIIPFHFQIPHSSGHGNGPSAGEIIGNIGTQGHISAEIQVE
jgi:hypothetical protein